MNQKVNVIIGREDLPKFRFFIKYPQSNVDTALVFVGKAQYFIDTFDNPVSKSELKHGGISQYYKIDMTPKNLILNEIVDNGDCDEFEIKILSTCRVKNPELIVKNNVEDIYLEFKNVVIQEIEYVCSEYTENEINNLKMKLRTILTPKYLNESLSKLGFECTKININVSKSSLIREHKKKLNRIKRDGEIAIAETEGKLNIEKLSNELEDIKIEKIQKHIEVSKDLTIQEWLMFLIKSDDIPQNKINMLMEFQERAKQANISDNAQKRNDIIKIFQIISEGSNIEPFVKEGMLNSLLTNFTSNKNISSNHDKIDTQKVHKMLDN